MTTLAYGAFQSTDFWGMALECAPFFLRCSVPAITVYCCSSILAEKHRIRVLGIALYVLVFFLMAFSFYVMGEYGPAHLAAAAGLPAWPLLFAMLVVKTILLYVRDYRRHRLLKRGGGASDVPVRPKPAPLR